MLRLKTASWFILFPALLVPAYECPAEEFTDWIMELPNMGIDHVSVDGANFYHAWESTSSQLTLPSILYMDIQQQEIMNAQAESFTFECSDCVARDVLDALTQNYGARWKTDPETGLIWIYPKSRALHELLPQEVSIENDARSVPMLSGILRPLLNRPELKLISVTRNSSSFNTHDYPVNLPAGEMSVRDILSHAAASMMDRTFVILEISEPLTGHRIEPQNIAAISNSIHRETAGARLFRKVELGVDYPRENYKPYFKSLSSDESAVRLRAAIYGFAVPELGASATQFRILNSNDRFVSHFSWQERANVALGFQRQYHISASQGSALEIQQFYSRIVSEGGISELDDQIALLTALEHLRVTGTMDAVTMIRDRNYAPDTLAGLEDDVAFIALRSESVFDVLTDPSNSHYIDTGGWAKSFLPDEYQTARTLQFTVVGASTQDESTSPTTPAEETAETIVVPQFADSEDSGEPAKDDVQAAANQSKTAPGTRTTDWLLYAGLVSILLAAGAFVLAIRSRHR